MENLINFQIIFEKLNTHHQSIRNHEFEECVFKNCDFSNCDLSQSMFIDCEFIDCNLSMVHLKSTGLKKNYFKNCKIMGAPFQECDDFLFEVRFEDCILDYASFANKKMHNTLFTNCSMKEVVFHHTQLNKSVFDNCNLDRAFFHETQLANADFRTAYNYKIDPAKNPMKKAKFSTAGICGLLDQYEIIVE